MRTKAFIAGKERLKRVNSPMSRWRKRAHHAEHKLEEALKLLSQEISEHSKTKAKLAKLK